MTDLREMDRFKFRCFNCGANIYDKTFLNLHAALERRISKLEQPVLGLKGGVDRQIVLKIIEEEFGRLDNV